MAARYTVNTLAAIALVAATAKTLVNWISASNALSRCIEMHVSFDGVTASAVPVLVELCQCTQATAGTSTSHTIVQSGGPTRTAQGTAQRAYTVEPTVITVLKEWLVSPNGGHLTLQFPLGREFEQITTADGLLIRCTAPATVNARAYLEIEEG